MGHEARPESHPLEARICHGALMTTATRPMPYTAQIAAMKNPMVQVELISPKDGGVATRTCWVPVRISPTQAWKLTPEMIITLKDSEEPERRWTIVTVSDPRDRDDIKSDWKVGGL